MDKVVDFLEKYVQWVAVALGGLFLAWMLWAYVLMTPVSVPNATSTLTPGTVDDYVAKSAATPLDNAIKSEQVIDIVKSAKSTVLPDFTEAMNGANQQVATLPPVWVDSQPSDITVGSGQAQQVNGPVLVTQLPEVPPAEIIEALSKRASVLPAPPAVVAGQPAAPAPAAALPGQPVAGGRDISYVRVSYTIPTTKIAEEFTKVNVPPVGTTTGIVAVKMMREELLPNGEWGTPVEVPLVNNNVPIVPLPPAGAGLPAINTFRAWADALEGQSALLRPIFYPVVSGEGPWDPSLDDALPVFDPKAIAAAKALKAKEEAALRKAAAPPPRAPSSPRSSGRGSQRGPGGPGGGAPAAVDPQRPASAGGVIGVQARPPGDPSQWGPNGPPGTPPPAGMPGMSPEQPGVPPVAAVTPGGGQPPADVFPPASFQAAMTAPFTAWAYDETVVEGHTYRYQVVYALRSPVYASNIVNPIALANTFDIWSKPDANAWSKPVEVKPTAEYYLAMNNWSDKTPPATVKVDVYKWAQGKWQVQTFTVAPGDKVGDTQGSVDYNTEATVVDVRYDYKGNNNLGRPYVLLLTADGRLVERDPTIDRANVRNNQLKQAIQLATPVAPAAGAPGMPGGPGMPVALPPNGGAP